MEKEAYVVESRIEVQSDVGLLAHLSHLKVDGESEKIHFESLPPRIIETLSRCGSVSSASFKGPGSQSNSTDVCSNHESDTFHFALRHKVVEKFSGRKKELSKPIKANHNAMAASES